jgi:hypothetical protein
LVFQVISFLQVFRPKLCIHLSLAWMLSGLLVTMARPLGAGGGDSLQIWKITVNIKEGEAGCPPAWRLGTD